MSNVRIGAKSRVQHWLREVSNLELGELYVCNENRSFLSMSKIRGLMEGQGPYASINYPSAKAVKTRGLPANGVVVDFCTFGDYSDAHKVVTHY